MTSKQPIEHEMTLAPVALLPRMRGIMAGGQAHALCEQKGQLSLNYDAVIFDLFGTLIDNASPDQLRRLFRDPATGLGGDPDEFATAWLGIYHDRAVGRLGSVANEIRHVCDLVGLQPTPEQLDCVLDLRLQAFREQSEPRATVLDTLAKLRSAGLKTGLISDCGSEVPDIWPDLALAPLLDMTVFSCCVGATKPDPSLYTLACERLSVEPSRCLYVGDGGSRELTGALSIGMRPILIRVDYEKHLDAHRPDAVEWTGPVISEISEILHFVSLP
jgi:putative hydrolase of the HAD superfamily